MMASRRVLQCRAELPQQTTPPHSALKLLGQEKYKSVGWHIGRIHNYMYT
jgi:hypothetical protein